MAKPRVYNLGFVGSRPTLSIMTIKDLKELLDTLDENLLVVVAKDSEGNGYTNNISLAVDDLEYRSLGYEGEVGEFDPSSNNPKCIVIFP